jgi:hypothetical protein
MCNIDIELTSSQPVQAFLLMNCAAFSAYFEELFDSTPCTAEQPWRFIAYSDEITPGNQLSNNNERKIQIVYWSFMEFGHRLSDETVWFTVCAKRSAAVNQISGGMSQIFGYIFKLLFCTEALTLAGCAFTLASGRRIRIYAKLACILQDGCAHKITWHTKGDTGVKYCLLCANVFSHRSVLVNVDGDGDIRCNCIRAEELQLETSDGIKEMIRKIHTRRSIDPPDVCDRREIVLGFTYSGYNLMVDPDLDDVVDPVGQFMHDWMHCCFVSGVWNITAQLLFLALYRSGMRDLYEALHAYVLRWRWPKRVNQNQLHKCFLASRRAKNKEAKKFKCQASEGLSLYAIIGIFLALLGDRCKAEVAAYLALCDVIDCFLYVTRGSITPQHMLTCVHLFLRKFCDAFGEEKMTPKFHWLLHFPFYLMRHGTLIACYVHERKHRMLKRYCNDIRNTAVFEHSVLAEVSLNRYIVDRTHHMCHIHVRAMH